MDSIRAREAARHERASELFLACVETAGRRQTSRAPGPSVAATTRSCAARWSRSWCESARAQGLPRRRPPELGQARRGDGQAPPPSGEDLGVAGVSRPPRPRLGQHGRRPPGHAGLPAARRRAQGPARRGALARAAQALPSRGGAARAPEAPLDREALRGRHRGRGRRRAPVVRDGVRRGPRAAPGALLGQGRAGRARAAGAVRRRLRGGALRARAGRRPPRPEAQQPARGRATGACASSTSVWRDSRSPASRRRLLTNGRTARGHARLHEPRAGRR